MKLAVLVTLALAVAGGAIALSIVFLRETGSEGRAVGIEPLTTLAAPGELTKTLPSSWMDGLKLSRGGESLLISCGDSDGDGLLTSADNPAYGSLEIPLEEEKACVGPQQHRDIYAGVASSTNAYNCDARPAPALIVAIGSAGTDLLDPSAGESTGVLDLINELQGRALSAGISTLPVLSTAAIFGADPPQTNMERFLANDIARRLDEMPCLRTILIGHSHGGATVTAVSAVLDESYAARIFGVLIDRTTVLYDRPETEFPSRTKILNVFQTNEGWHGEPLGLPNVYNVDQSYERAPVALSDGGGGYAAVTHKTLDDAPGVRRLIVDAVMTWLGEQPAQ
ncbi:MAG: hypothetical protein HY873_11615 [Chloroflexi bacterium]|nr:hypothetical protein [Chloroflexota bacterium]